MTDPRNSFKTLVDNSKPVTETPLLQNYSPDQPREDDGKWTSGAWNPRSEEVIAADKRRLEELVAEGRDESTRARWGAAIAQHNEALGLLEKNPADPKGLRMLQDSKEGVKSYDEHMREVNRLRETGKLVGRYSATTYAKTNNMLRAGRITPAIKTLLEELAVEEKVKPGVTVYRGISLKAGSARQYKVGTVISDKGIASTSLDKDTAVHFATKKSGPEHKDKIVFEWSDTKGLGRKISPRFPSSEREVVYPPGTKVKIVAIERQARYTLVKGIIK